jgi:putative ABC transport system substrate-binding protein
VRTLFIKGDNYASTLSPSLQLTPNSIKTLLHHEESKMYVFKNLTQTFKFLLLSFLLSFSPASSDPIKISILQTIEHPALNATREGLVKELNRLGYEEGKTLTLDYQSAQGNTALAAQIAQKFSSDQANVIVAIGTTAAQAALNATKDNKIPVIFSSVTDPLSAKLVDNLKTPEGHVSGVSNFVSVEPQFKLFKKLQPNLKTLGVIYNPGEANSVAMLDNMEKTAKDFDMKIVTATAAKTSEVLSASRSLCGKVDAIFINNDNTALAAFKSVVKATGECKIPAFVSDVDLFDQGAMAALGPDQADLGRQTARMVDFVLKNPNAPFPPVEFPEKTKEFVKFPLK